MSVSLNHFQSLWAAQDAESPKSYLSRIAVEPSNESVLIDCVLWALKSEEAVRVVECLDTLFVLPEAVANDPRVCKLRLDLMSSPNVDILKAVLKWPPGCITDDSFLDTVIQCTKSDDLTVKESAIKLLMSDDHPSRQAEIRKIRLDTAIALLGLPAEWNYPVNDRSPVFARNRGCGYWMDYLSLHAEEADCREALCRCLKEYPDRNVRERISSVLEAYAKDSAYQAALFAAAIEDLDSHVRMAAFDSLCWLPESTLKNKVLLAGLRHRVYATRRFVYKKIYRDYFLYGPALLTERERAEQFGRPDVVQGLVDLTINATIVEHLKTLPKSDEFAWEDDYSASPFRWSVIDCPYGDLVAERLVVHLLGAVREDEKAIVSDCFREALGTRHVRAGAFALLKKVARGYIPAGYHGDQGRLFKALDQALFDHLPSFSKFCHSPWRVIMQLRSNEK